VKPVLKLLESVKVKGLAHITGGGVVGNVPRMLPKNVVARINKSAWERPDVFKWLQQTGNVAEDEMWRVFNCGIGMVAAVAPADVQTARALLEREGERVYEIGTIEKSSGEPDAVVV
jgi:phosphoribosylformylglycinamidine cyclo-ligase